MFNRDLNILENNSFFLFGPRGSGKTTYLKQFFKNRENYWIDLLKPIEEDLYSRNPETLSKELELKKNIEWVVIDEVQKLPKLLDLVHHHIESSNIKFALTGSSARKLKKGAANLLAGRAFMNHLFPLTSFEMENEFNLEVALEYGMLPKITKLKRIDEKNEFLKTYALTYLKEEIWAEHIVRQLDPFRRFIEIAAQTNGQIVNYSNISKDVGVDTKTVQSYFEILSDTLVGILLEPYHKSIRKRQRQNPKFYLFDTGVKRALDRTLSIKLLPQTFAFGKAFEHFVILEAYKLNEYHKKDFQFSYLRTKDDAEIDLIIERPGLPDALVEIKSSDNINKKEIKTLEAFLPSFKNAEAYCLSRDKKEKKIGSVIALPWQKGLKEIGL